MLLWSISSAARRLTRLEIVASLKLNECCAPVCRLGKLLSGCLSCHYVYYYYHAFTITPYLMFAAFSLQYYKHGGKEFISLSNISDVRGTHAWLVAGESSVIAYVKLWACDAAARVESLEGTCSLNSL